MPPDIIDNRSVKLAGYIRDFLPDAESAKFAVGYFFLSGMEVLGASLDEIGELRLLIGNTSNRETIEHLSEAYKRLDVVEQKQEEQRFIKRADRHERADETASNLRETISLMDQTGEGEELVCSLIRMVEEGRLKVRVYTKGRLHAKAYIFDWSRPNPGNNGIAIVGSSNLTLSGIQDNTELNVLVHDNASPADPASGNHGALSRWFSELWDESQDFDELLMAELRESWAAGLASPYEVYLKTLYTLVQDRLDEDEATILPPDRIYDELADFQKVAVEQAIRIIRRQRGCFVADVVGLGKSYIGAAIIKYFQRAEGSQPLIICPKPLEEMWQTYNAEYDLHAEVLSMSMLLEDDAGADLLGDPHYSRCDFILIDESHNFRHTDTQRYRELQNYLTADNDRRVCLLTATPRNSRAWDVFNQIKLFHPDDRTDLPIDPPNLREYFKKIERDEGRDGADEISELQDVLRHILIRRTRRHILRWYGHAEDTGQPLREMTDSEARRYLDGGARAYVNVGGRKQFFPRRELETLRYSIESTYDGLYDELRGYLGRPRKRAVSVSKRGQELTYARYGLWNYVDPRKRNRQPYVDLRRSGQNLRGLMRTMLFKRFESSVHAFRETLRRMVQTQSAFLLALDDGIVPAGQQAERLLGRGNVFDDQEEDLLDALREVTGNYNIEDFDVERLRDDIEADIDLLGKMIELVEPITPDRDDKLLTLQRRLSEPPLAGRKILLFTQYADTAQYLYDDLNPGERFPDIEYIYGNDKSKARIVARFSPKANPQIRLRSDEPEIRLLVATDVLAEGLNMQDCDVVINYDLHWNPVRLIQRFGRIDRIGSEHDTIWGYNFLPERGLEKNLGIHQVLHNRIQEIHDTIGEDAQILDKTERLNEDAMYAIYESRPSQLSFLPAEEEDQFVDLNEAEEFMRQLRLENPEEFQRIADLRDGIRAARPTTREQTYVFCRSGDYFRLYLVNKDGEIVTSDTSRVLGAIRADRETPALSSLPRNHNERVMATKRQFVRELEDRAGKQQRSTANRAQGYIRRQLQELHRDTEDEERRMTISTLERAFTAYTPTAAVRRELNFLQRNRVTGDTLIARLTEIYHQHGLQHRDPTDRHTTRPASDEVPRIVCSMALV